MHNLSNKRYIISWLTKDKGTIMKSNNKKKNYSAFSSLSTLYLGLWSSSMLSAIGLFSVSGRRKVRNPADSPLIPNTTNGTEGLRDF